MLSFRSRASISALVVLLGACEVAGSPPPRDSAVLSEASVPSEIYTVDALDGRAYGLGYDNVVYEMGEPSRAVVDASAIPPGISAFRMESADTAWVQSYGDDGDDLHRIGSGATIITRADLSTATGLDASLGGFDVGPDGTLWILVHSAAYDSPESAVCARPIAGPLSCTTSTTILGGAITAVGNGAMLYGFDTLQFFADGVVTDLPIPGGANGVESVSALGASRALIVATDMYAWPTGIYSVDTTGAAIPIVDGRQELIGMPEIDVFVRGESDVWFSTSNDEWIEDCNPFSLSTCTAGHYAWQQYVVWHWDGAALSELGHVDLGRDAAASTLPSNRHVIPVDANAFLLEVSGLAWRGSF